MSRTVDGSGSVEPSSSARPHEPPTSANDGRRWAALGWLPMLAVAAGFLAYGTGNGMSSGTAVRAGLAVALTQVLPGALAWRAVRPRAGWWAEDLAMGYAVGAVVAVGAQVVAGLTRWPWISAAMGPAIAVVLLIVPGTRERIRSARTSPMPWWWGASVAASSLVALPVLEDYFRRVPVEPGLYVVRPDQYFHLAVSGQLATRGPTTFPWLESEPLGYHWFSHAWVAQVSEASGAGLDQVLFRFMPVVMPLVLVLAVATAAVRLSGRFWTGPIAALLTLAGGSLNALGKNTHGYPIGPLSLSLGFSAPLLVATVVVLALRWRGVLGSGSLVLLPALCIGAAGAKGSTAPLLVAGLGVAAVVMWVVNRPRLRPVLIDLAIVTACLAFVLVTVIRGATQSLHIDPSAAAEQTDAARWLGGAESTARRIFVLGLAVTAELTRAVGTFGLLTSRSWRRDPLTWLLIGASVAGALAVAVLTHILDAQYFFARSAAPLMALGSALGLAVLVDKLGTATRRTVALGILAGPVLVFAPLVLGPLGAGGTRHAVAMIGVAVTVLALAGALTAVVVSKRAVTVATVLIVAVLAGGVTIVAKWMLAYEPPPEPRVAQVVERNAVTRDQIAAARWIRDHSDVDDLVMTNRHCVRPHRPDGCDSRRFATAAFSERQMLVEGWAYTQTAAELAPDEAGRVDFWDPELLTLNDGFIAQPTAAAARELRERDVRWVFVDNSVTHAATLEPFARMRFDSPGADVYELDAG